MEPARGDGHRPLPARAPPPRRSRLQSGPPVRRARGAAAVAARPTAYPIIGIDNLPGSVALETYDLPRECVLVFGQEGRD
jgi:tRNA G18 (ribose-2'-O)-methylase SpoU